MANTVAIVSVVSTAVVAVAVPFISARLERRRLAWESRQRQLDELRALLDASTLRAQEAVVLLNEVREVCAPYMSNEDAVGRVKLFSGEMLRSDVTRLQEASTEYETKLQQLIQDGIRIEIRLGSEDPVTKRHLDILFTLFEFKSFRPLFVALASGEEDVIEFVWPVEAHAGGPGRHAQLWKCGQRGIRPYPLTLTFAKETSHSVGATCGLVDCSCPQRRRGRRSGAAVRASYSSSESTPLSRSSFNFASSSSVVTRRRGASPGGRGAPRQEADEEGRGASLASCRTDSWFSSATATRPPKRATAAKRARSAYAKSRSSKPISAPAARAATHAGGTNVEWRSTFLMLSATSRFHPERNRPMPKSRPHQR